MKFEIDNFRNNKKKDRNFHDDVNDRFNKFSRNKNRDKNRKNEKKIVQKAIAMIIKKKNDEKMIVNDDEKIVINDEKIEKMTRRSLI